MLGEIRIANSRVVFFIAALSIVVVGASVDIFVPSLPFIHEAFRSSMQETQLLVAVYLIAYGVFQLVAGSVADSFGRRRTMLISLFGYVLASFLIPFSSHIDILLLLRFAQGICAAGIGVVSRVLLSDSFSGTTLGKKASYLNFAWAIGPIFSPYLGGYLQHLFGWQASFYFLGGYSLLVAVLAAVYLPETASLRHKFNVKTMVGNYRTVFSARSFIIAALVCGCAYGFITIYNVAGPFMVERVMGYSPVVYGRIALLLGVAWLGGNLLCRYIVTKSFANVFIRCGLVVGVFVAAVMAILSLSGYFNLWVAVVPPLFLFCIVAMIFSYLFGQGLSVFPKIGGAASAVMGSIYSVMAAGFSAFGTLLKASSLTPLALSYFGLVVLAAVLYFFKNRVVVGSGVRVG